MNKKYEYLNDLIDDQVKDYKIIYQSLTTIIVQIDNLQLKIIDFVYNPQGYMITNIDVYRKVGWLNENNID